MGLLRGTFLPVHYMVPPNATHIGYCMYFPWGETYGITTVCHTTVPIYAKYTGIIEWSIGRSPTETVRGTNSCEHHASLNGTLPLSSYRCIIYITTLRIVPIFISMYEFIKLYSYIWRIFPRMMYGTPKCSSYDHFRMLNVRDHRMVPISPFSYMRNFHHHTFTRTEQCITVMSA